MPALKILIVGGGCGGPALGYWLARGGHKATIVERAPVLRASGTQIDLRAQGIEVVRRMGLLDVVRAARVDEVGFAMVDSAGRVQAAMMANTSGQGQQSLTSEYEIMRGDLVRILYAATKDRVTYVFDTTVDTFQQDATGVDVKFSNGTSDRYDLLVGADGQSSRIRQAMLPSDAPDPIFRLGLYFAYWFAPRTPTDTNLAKMYFIPGKRSVISRTHSPTEAQALFGMWDSSVEMRSLPRAPVAEQKAFLDQKFRGSGWETDRFLDAMYTTDNFYCQEIVQVRSDTWSRGRVVLVADAAHCPSPITGMGTTSAFVGAYVLAGELSRHSDDIPRALASYDRILRPFIKEIQLIRPWLVRFLYPQTALGVAIFHWLAWFICLLRIPDIIDRLGSEERGGWDLPDYPEFQGDQAPAKATEARK